MITALEALSLPTAQISDSDREAAQVILAELDAHVRKYMSRTGCMVPSAEPQVGSSMRIDRNRLNGPILNEVGNECRRRGWIMSLEELQRQSEITRQVVVVGHQIALRPREDVLDAWMAHGTGAI